jgi:nicotinate-nucleotide adenylyltransferase
MGGATLGALVSRGAAVVAGTVGVFGGTFDPIHYAHLALAEEAAQALGLERVLFVPAGQPPHKPGRDITPGEDRLAMVELAIAGNARFAVDRQELDRAGPSYTLDTLLALRGGDGGSAGPSGLSRGPAPELTLILSSEAFAELPSWHEPRRILELARIAVAPREGYPDARAVVDQQYPGLADRVVFLDGPRMRLSASELRERAAAGRSLRYLVPDAVAAYIDDHALYRNPRRNQPS